MTTTKIHGWVQDVKDLGGMKFIQLQHSETQITLSKQKQPELIKIPITKESVIYAEGILQQHKGKEELHPTKLELISRSEPSPISSDSTLTKRFDWRSLDLRKRQKIFKVQSALIQGMQEHLLKKDFMQVFTPCLMGIASESGSEVFPVVYYDKEAFLRQDPQLHRQLTIAGGFTKIFEIGPAWRAEQSYTSRHLSEHRVLAVEFTFITEKDVMDLQEELIISALTKAKHLLDIEIPKQPFPRLSFDEVKKILKKEITDLETEDERILADYIKKKYHSDFYFIYGFPIKPFYVMHDKQTTKSVDLYYKHLELSSGGQREHRYEQLLEKVKEKQVKDIEWFTKFFKYGIPPHGGFAIGIERLTQAILEIDQIKECVLFPRDPDRLVP